jgi:membrane associated rhomboid family serine protease
MILLIPHEIETLKRSHPWANWLIIGTCVFFSLAALSGSLSNSALRQFVLDGWNPVGIFGHVLLHGGLMHLIGNMIFLWVFGNAVCTNTSNWLYIPTFLFCTLFAAIVHLVADGHTAIGASGAINGIVGIILAMYPLNRVHVWWFFIAKGGSFACSAWIIIIFWLFFDFWGVYSGGGGVAYWAHIGGLLGGVTIGLTCLQMGWFKLTEYDNRSLLHIIKGEELE